MKRGLHYLLGLLVGLWSLGVGAATYTSASTTFSWIDASTHTRVGYNTAPYKFNALAGCGTSPPIIDDTISDEIPLGFTFLYGGTGYTSVRIMTNGRLQFNNTFCGYGTQSSGPPQTYPYGYPNANMDRTMKVFGVDLDPTNTLDSAGYPPGAGVSTCNSHTNCYIRYATLGTSPNRQFVVTWWHVPEWVSSSNTSGSFDVQIILNENGTFQYQYGTISHGGTGTAEVGWQLTSTDYEKLSFGASTEPPPNTAILFYIPATGPFAEYRFDEGAWLAGEAGQVTDYSGNNRPGTAFGSAQEHASGKVCRAADIPANTTAAAVSAVRTGVSLADASLGLPGKGTIMFWYLANAAWNSGTAAQLLDATTASNQWFYLTKTGSGTLYFQVTDSDGNLRSVETPAKTFAANTWVHVAVTWDFNASPTANSDKLQIFIEAGVPTASSFTSNGTLAASVGYVYAGDNPSGFVGTKGTVNSANGRIDELRFYNYLLNQGQVAGERSKTNTCQTFNLHHFELRHGSWTGPACVQGTLNVVACANAACSTYYTGGVIATLSATGASTVWDAASGGATVIVGASQSSTTKKFYTATGTSTFDIAGTNFPVNPSNGKVCNGSGGSCVWTATQGGLLVAAPDSGVITGGKPVGVTVQAVQSTGPNPGDACAPVAGLTGMGMKVWATPDTPATFAATTTSAGATVGGSPQMANASGGAYAYAPTSEPGAANLSSLAFDANAATTVWVKHMDTGRWVFNGKISVPATSTTPALTLAGTGTVISVPVGYGISAAAVTAPAATQLACAAGPAAGCDTAAGADAMVARAGATFGMSAIAALWTADGDTNLSDNPRAPNYAGSVALTPILVGPSGGGVGSLGVSSLTLSGGQASTTGQTVSRSGALRVIGSATYLGQSINTSGPSQQTLLNPAWGRFAPHHFSVAPAAGCGTFTYSAQPFSSVTVTAMDSAATPAVDVNYRAAFSRTTTLSDATAATVGVLSANTISTFTAGEGVAQPLYTFSATETVPTAIKLRATDTDGTVSSGESASDIRSGRLRLFNAYGPATQALILPVQVEYWNTGWQQNGADSCTILVAPTEANGGLLNALKDKTTATVSMPGGVSLAAPTGGVHGLVDVSGSVLRGTGTWLGLPSPLGRACFGTCEKSRRPIIYLRERF